MDINHLNKTIEALPKVQRDLIDLCELAITNAMKALAIVAPKATIDLALSRIMLTRMVERANTPPTKPKPGNVPGNTGHGHVYRRPDGVRARCGGPSICSVCALDATKRSREIIEELGYVGKKVE